MPSNIDALLNPISEESPCGDEHTYSRKLRESLISLRKPEVPNGDGDLNYRRAADWDAIIEMSSTALSEQTKDIRIVCHLIEAWTQVRNFDGLLDGLTLLTDFVETCWDRSNPRIDDGDLEVRSAPIENMLDDPDRGICFPTTIRQIPLLGTGERACSYFEYKELQQQGETGRETLEQVVASTDVEQFTTLASSIDQSLVQLDALKKAFSEKLGSLAPGLTYLRSAITDCQQVVQYFLPQLSVNAESAEPGVGEDDEQNDESPTAAVVSKTKQKGLNSRSDAYRQLTEAAEFLRKTEPHSPIPYLVFRAVELGKLPFPKLVRQLIREDGILNELQREFGISQIAEEGSDIG